MVLAPHAPDAKLTENIGDLEVHRFRYFITRWQSLAYHGGIMANLKQSRLRYLLIPFFMFFELVNLISLLRKYRIDAIHAHWLIPQGLVAVMARVFVTGHKPAIVCTVHGSDLLGLQGAMFRWLQKKVIEKVDKLTVVSTSLRTHATDLVNRDDVEVMPMGVDLAEVFVPPAVRQRSGTELLFVGRLVERKGVHYLLQALPEIIKTHPQATLSIVGDGPEKENLRRLAVEYGVGGHVSFLGAIENSALSELYGRATLFVSPSLAEGLGLAIVEAMGCACPVVATDLPAMRDIVVDNITGLICAQSNSADLAAKICFLLDHPELRVSMGRAGRQHVQGHFDWSVIAGRYACLIDELVMRRA